MADIWYDVDTALAEVPVNMLPLLDDTDFKSREVAVAYNAAGMDLVWNFVTPAGAYTQTAVTPTTSGTYDWAHQGDAMYSIEVPASGGASINNDTEGFGWFTGICTGVLAWRSFLYGFRAAGLNDLLIESAFSTTRGLTGTAVPAAAAGAAGGLLTCTSANVLPTDSIVAGSIGPDAIGSSELAATAVAEIATAVALEVLADDPISGLNINAIKAKTDNLPSDPADASVVAGLIAAVETKVDTVDTVVDAVKAKTDNLPSDPADASVVAGLIAAVETKVDTVDTVVDAILMDTGTDGVVVAAGSKTGYALSTAGVDAILDDVVEGTITFRQMLRLFGAALGGELSGAATTTIVIRNASDSKTVITATVDADGNRSAVSLDLT